MRTEKALARRAAAGDEAAFEAIFRRYHQEIYRYCRAILRRDEDAQDALQATMVAALRSLPGEGREIALKPWLYRVAHNEAITILRGRRPLMDPHESPESPVRGADHELDERHRLRRLVADLQALPDRQRSAIVMRELSGLSFAEIAAALETSEATARQTLYEARTSLADMEEGRALTCAEVRHAISDGDGRVLRGRRMRAHLRSCQGCTDFRAAITTRKAELHTLVPPLPALAASSVLASALAAHAGGGAAGSATAAGAGAAGVTAAASGGAAGTSGVVGGGIAASGAVKAVSLVAVVAIGAGAADATNVVHLPLLHGAASTSNRAEPAAESRRIGQDAGGHATRGAPSKRSDPGQGPARGRPARGRRAGHGPRGRPSDTGRPASPGSNGRGQGQANGNGPPDATGGSTNPNGRAVGPSQGGSPGESGSAGAQSSHASESGVAHSSGAAHGSQPNGTGRPSAPSSSAPPAQSNSGNGQSGGSNAGGSDPSSEAPGRTTPPRTLPVPPVNGNPGGLNGAGVGNG